MININNYISEKLHLNKDFESSEINNIDKVKDIIIATYLCIMIYKIYKENSTFQKQIYWGRIDYEEIINILNNYFQYSFSMSDINRRDGDIFLLIKKHRRIIEWLVNRSRVTITFGNDSMHLSGRELYDEYYEYIDGNKKLYK